MGITTETITRTHATCDFCGAGCGENDNLVKQNLTIAMQDVGPVRAFGRIHVDVPYGPVSGHLCLACTKKALTKWIENN